MQIASGVSISPEPIYGQPASSLPLIANAAETSGCNCAAASDAAVMVRGHPVAAARYASGDAFSVGASPRDQVMVRGHVVVDSRARVGDWEGDTIVRTGLARVVTLIECKSGPLRRRRILDGKANTVVRAVVGVLHPLQARVHTLTWDNGSEFAEHALMSQCHSVDIALKARSYFADPYSSRQRGTNESMAIPFWGSMA